MQQHFAARCFRARSPAARALVRTIAIAAALVAARPATCDAQSRTFYLDRLFMAGAPDDAIALWRPQLGERTRFFGQIGLGMAVNPFRVENEIANVGQNRALVKRDNGTPV